MAFQDSLRLFDPLLSVRACEYTPGEWIIERKAVVPELETQFLRRRFARLSLWIKDATRPQHDVELKTWREVGEELYSAERAKRVVLTVQKLDRNVFDALCFGDIKRYGGYSRMADEWDEQDKRRQKFLDQRHASEREELNREAFDVLNFLVDHRSTALAHGQRDVYFMLHGRHKAREEKFTDAHARH